MAYRHKFLYTVSPSDLMSSNLPVQLKVIGIFDTSKVFWTYYVASTITTTTNILQLTDDICSTCANGTIESIKSYAMKFEDIDTAKKYIDDFKIKWETGSNNTTQEIRDQKLKELTKD